jgi:hypothetical protein
VLGDDESYFQLVLDLTGLQNATMVKWDGVALDPVSVFEEIAGRPRTVHAVVREMLIQAGLRHGARVVMDKSLDSVRYWEEQLAVCPDLIFLNLVRDPRAQVSSMNRAIIHDFDSVLNALTWKNAHDRAQALISLHPERVLTIRYEDFITEPEPELRRMCRFPGIACSGAMLNAAASDEARQIARRSALWRSNDKRLMPEFMTAYTRYLSPGDIELIETITGGHMARYGYAPATAAQATAEVTGEARARSAQARQAAWRSLRADDLRDCQLRCYRAWYLQALRERLGAPPPAWLTDPPARARDGQ